MAKHFFIRFFFIENVNYILLRYEYEKIKKNSTFLIMY
jgi:hypothetical protein